MKALLLLFQYLEKFGFLRPQLRDRLSQTVRTAVFTKGEYLIKMGRRMEHIYFLKSGTVHRYRAVEGKIISIWISGAGSILFQPELFMENAPSSDALVALEDCEVQYLTRDEILAIYKDFPETKQMGKAIVHELQEKLRQHVFHVNDIDKSERVRYLMEKFPDLFYRLDRDILASFLGLSASTFYRLKKKFLRSKPY